jgi:hypothetical protein
MPMVAQPLHELPALTILFFARNAKRSIYCGSGSLCNHWHIEAATAQCATEIEAEMYQNLPDLENRLLH